MRAAEPTVRRPLDLVVVPTDFSEGAERALDRALMLPLGREARVHVLHVLPVELPAKLRKRAESEARARLEPLVSRARARLGAAEVDVTSELGRGDPFVEIIRTSRSLDADLVVLGRHGLRPVRDMFIGTTAERVVRKGDVPVLVVHLEPAHPYHRPVVATDLADASRRTLDLALRVLGDAPRSVDVVHACHVPFEGFVAPSASAREKSELRRAAQETAETALTKLLAPYQALDVRWRPSVRAGDARAVIIAAAARRRADVVALGTHARSGLAHALLGSVAEWVVTAAPCDVLVARPVRFSFALP
ncbi:universal stress protein [Myxococcota bacterium]|nr:universal stress protein [Myxococcota bacterium]